MRFFKARDVDVANGPGIRATIWLCGCSRHCKGCFNQELADFNAGSLLTPSRMKNFAEIGKKNKEIVGYSILGGEPLEQDKHEMLQLLRMLKNPKKTIWMWTGYTYENLTEDQIEIVKIVDVLVDGPFIEELKNPNLRFRGSSNQRIIDIKETLKSGSVKTMELFN